MFSQFTHICKLAAKIGPFVVKVKIKTDLKNQEKVHILVRLTVSKYAMKKSLWHMYLSDNFQLSATHTLEI